jgi:hypothetical protein
MKRFTAAVLLLLSPLAACSDPDASSGTDDGGGGGSGGSDGGGSGEVLLDDLPRTYAEVICARAFRCCTEPQRDDGFSVTPPIREEAGCRQHYEELVEAFVVEPARGSLAAGRASYDAAEVRRCLDRAAAAGCEDGTADPEDHCDFPFVGLVAAGERCERDLDCEGEAACNSPSDGNPEEDGICEPLPGEGETCEGSTCAGDAFCDHEADPSLCVPKRADGSPCSDEDECVSGECPGETPEGGGTCAPPDGCYL